MLNLLLFFLMTIFSTGAFADMIMYRENDRVKVYKDATLQYVNQKYTSFLSKGKVLKISTSSILSIQRNGKSLNYLLQNNSHVKNDNPLPVPSKPIKPLFPTKLAAYILHGRYLFCATKQSKGWHYGKEVTISGVINLYNIKRIKRSSLANTRLTGRYLIPMLDGKIICVSQSLPKEIALAKAKRYRYLVMKFKGIVRKSSGYKEAFIDNAQYVSSRVISYSLRWKKNDLNDTSLTYTSKFLVNCQNLKDWCYLDLYMDGRMGRLQCEMGADPEAYAMEIFWLRKLHRKYRNLRVTFSYPKRAKGLKSSLSDVEIVGWWRSSKKRKRL